MVLPAPFVCYNEQKRCHCEPLFGEAVSWFNGGLLRRESTVSQPRLPSAGNDAMSD